MPYDISGVLVVGISTRALFNLDKENEIFEKAGLEAFLAYQREHEDEILAKGTAYPFIEALLKLNVGGRRVEVVVMSRNHPDVFLRIWNSIRHYGLDITRSLLNGGEPLARYYESLKIDLVLSALQEDVRAALDSGLAAGLVYAPPVAVQTTDDQVRVAFDGDCVLFSDEAEIINQTDGIDAFHAHEREKALIPLGDGPFAKLVRLLSSVQEHKNSGRPFRIGLVTARNAPSHERALRTLRHWGVRIDNAAFLGGLPKDGWLVAFRPHIFFDDQKGNCDSASPLVPTARVPVEIRAIETPVVMSQAADARAHFLVVCRSYLRTRKGSLEIFEQWFDSNVASQEGSTRDALLSEFNDSVQQTPVGHQRPGREGSDENAQKLLSFLGDLLRKHTQQR